MVVVVSIVLFDCHMCFFFQAEDGIRYLVRSRGLGDVYKRQVLILPLSFPSQKSMQVFQGDSILTQPIEYMKGVGLSLIHI